MSFRKENIFSPQNLTEVSYLAGETEEGLVNLFSEILQNGVHGFCFSLYEEGQKPGDIISEAQVRRRMEILRPHTRWIRSFSCTEGNEFIPKVAKEYGLKTLVGAWLGNDPEINRREVEGLIKLADEGLVDIAAVGNEVMYRKDLSEEELLGFIQEVKSRIPTIPVGYVDAYYEFSHRTKITEACDVVLCNCYPFWEGCSFENSLGYMQQMYQQAKKAANGKQVIITETGWPSEGESLKGSVPSMQHARDYFINTQLWSANDDIPVFYFSSFDESWKTGAEGIVGAYWGIWDKQEKLKF
ncbi:MAG: glycosyl hydrolase [Chitinophagaceae bacterium]|nr:glycosyl hydrolase [Chitinophagaceae bacterium]MBK7679974.1 glycosyl hydrolase [Chitinophagaceae bacterium]MBK9465660.1 glycosyl hydrolase [Chitinophagaceae bacterium]MBK9660610.1 glycosyl hydrolase [Chitinophagaceae bacterium]MBK9937681.1 glycosyl hydrolase [Chitinophagaceae bacterium]